MYATVFIIYAVDFFILFMQAMLLKIAQQLGLESPETMALH